MKFRQYLMEIKANVVYDNNWILRKDKGVGTYIHIDKTDNSITANTKVTEFGKWNYAVSFSDNSRQGINVFEFWFNDDAGTTNATGEGGEFKYSVFGAIESVFAKLITYLPSDSIVIFRALKSEPSRIKIYDRFIKKIEKIYPFILSDENVLKIFKRSKTHKQYGFCLDKSTFDMINSANIKLDLGEQSKSLRDFK